MRRGGWGLKVKGPVLHIALYNLGSDSWFAWANDTAAHYALSIARVREQSDPRCSMQTSPLQSATLGLHPVACKLLLICRPGTAWTSWAADNAPSDNGRDKVGTEKVGLERKGRGEKGLKFEPSLRNPLYGLRYWRQINVTDVCYDMNVDRRYTSVAYSQNAAYRWLP